MAQHLREIMGDDKLQQPLAETQPKVKLDGKEITREELDKAKENQGVRIIETNPGEHKTLQHLRG